MPTTCYIKISDEDGMPHAQSLRKLTFEEVPRVGEFVAFSGESKPDEDGVVRSDLYRVKYVIHSAANALSPRRSRWTL